MDIKKNLIGLVLTSSLIGFSGSANAGFPNVSKKYHDIAHFGISATSAFASSMLMDSFFNPCSSNLKCWAGFGLGIVPGIYKEYQDNQKGSKIDEKDLTLDFIGAALGAWTYHYLMDLFGKKEEKNTWNLQMNIYPEEVGVKYSFNF